MKDMTVMPVVVPAVRNGRTCAVQDQDNGTIIIVHRGVNDDGTVWVQTIRVASSMEEAQQWVEKWTP